MTRFLRLFVTADFAVGDRILLSDDQARYLVQVMRRRPGDPIRLFNGRDGEWTARVITVGRQGTTVQVEARIRPQQSEPGPWLVFALLKRDSTDLVVRMATELGAEVIAPALTCRTVSSRVNLDRLRAIAVEAAEQSERLTLPAIERPRPLAEILDSWPSDRPLFAAVERCAGNAPRPRRAGSGLLVGPEGGFAPNELDALRDRPIVTFVSLGARVLRAETACVTGLALLQAPGCGE